MASTQCISLCKGINDRVKQDIIRIFDNKTISQLLELERQIKTKLNSKDTIDIGYWETLLRELKVICWSEYLSFLSPIQH